MLNLAASMASYHRIVILTGAGLSAESGLGTFRDEGGIWTKHDLADIATPEGFARNPALVQDFYNARRSQAAEALPNAAHLALARLESEHASAVLTVTQNVDCLHEAAGTSELIHMHGELFKTWCPACDWRDAWRNDITPQTPCPACGKTGSLRPDVVWFGEMPYRMDEIYSALGACDLFISIGTSGSVYPAAGFVVEAASARARTVELNLEPSEGASLFDDARHGPATEVVPAFIDHLLDQKDP